VKLIVGLGNPGIEYQFTPHNMGYLAIDRIADRQQVKVGNRHCRALTARTRIGEQDVLLVKPETFMNLSGLSVRELLEEYEADPIRDLLVLYDELDLPLGTIRVRERGSAAGHNGISSVIEAVGTQEVPRIRIGIDPERERSDGMQYVLSQWKKKDLEVVDRVLDTVAEAVEVVLKEGIAAAMNRYNRKADGAVEAQ
jgi:peptidyl-tRNA hydrolase, PTH1 family